MEPLRIVIDTREQTAWNFPAELATCRRAKLDAGDYAIDGDTRFAIERKTLDDFVGTISTGWPRFLRELGRMDAAGFVAKPIIVEADAAAIYAGRHNHPKVGAGFLLKRISQLMLMNAPVYLAGNTAQAIGLAWQMLRERQKQSDRKL